jgi:hypothetical protein
MKKSIFSEQQSLCGDLQCKGLSSCENCNVCLVSRVIHESITCPYKVPYCCMSKMCDMCIKINRCQMCKNVNGSTLDCEWCYDFLKTFEKDAITKPETRHNFAKAGGGVRKLKDVVPDFIPEQRVFSLSSSSSSSSSLVSSPCKCRVDRPDELCDECLGKRFGSIGMNEHHSNPNTPPIVFDDRFGPKPNELGPFTEETQRLLDINMMGLFERFKKRNWQWKLQFPKLDITRNVVINLIRKGIHAGFEGINNNCFVVVILMMFSLDMGLRSRINTDIYAGFLMRYITAKFRSSLFVDRGLIELFRTEVNKLIVESDGPTFMGVSCPNEFLMFLEKIDVVKTGPCLSKNSDDNISASFIVQEANRPGKTDKNGNQMDDGIPFNILPNAISHAVGSTVLPNDGILCFQFREKKDDTGTGAAKYAGSGEMGFPQKPLSVNKRRLDVFAFTHFGGSHYQIILCFDGMYLNFNSNSPVNEGHYLPVLSILSEEEAHAIFKQKAHTVVFKCRTN